MLLLHIPSGPTVADVHFSQGKTFLPFLLTRRSCPSQTEQRNLKTPDGNKNIFFNEVHLSTQTCNMFKQCNLSHPSAVTKGDYGLFPTVPKCHMFVMVSIRVKQYQRVFLNI